MNPIYSAVCLVVAALAVVAAGAPEQQKDLQNVGQEMKHITESLDDLLGQLALIKQEATGRLSKYKGAINSEQPDNQAERIRQTKVSRFVLKRVSELESESMRMRDELAQLARVQLKDGQALMRERRFAVLAETKQEDLDFDEPNTTQEPSSTTQQQGMPAQPTTTTTTTSTSTTTMKPEEEAAKIGFDIEALKKLGEEIGKRLDQFGKEAVKNLGDLIEGVKLVFREPAAPTNSSATATASKSKPAKRPQLSASPSRQT